MTHLDWTKIGLNNISGTAGNKKVYCPQCHANRNDKGDKSLSINLETGVYNCHYCGFSGSVAETDLSTVRKQTKFYKRPVEREAKPLSEKLLTWFAGRGISKDTLTLARISEGLEFMPQKGKEANTLQFNFYLNGELINTKFRTGDKNFKLVSGARLIPWNIDAIKNQQSCIITEGEIDALSFIECGFLNAVSVPNGASKNLDYLDDFIESHFDDKESIYIAVDTDTKGVQLKDELLRRFGVERCRVIDYGEGCKDANEHLQKFGKESLANLIHNAPEPTMEGVYSIYDFETNLDALFENGLQKGFTIGHENFNALCSFETKRLAVVTGVPGCLTGDALVSMADGSQKPIKDVQVGDEVLSLDSGFNCVSRKVITKWDCGKKEVYKVKFKDGFDVKSSAIHKYLTFDGWKEAKDLQKGDFVLLSRSNFGGKKDVDKDLAKLLAIWIAEGSKANSSFVVSVYDDFMINELKRICKVFNLRYFRSKGGETIISSRNYPKCNESRYISLMSYEYRRRGLEPLEAAKKAKERYAEKIANGQSKINPLQELERFGLRGKTAKTIRVPKELFLQEKSVVSSFLNTLFACDGCVHRNTIEYSSVSKNLCLDIQFLLLKFGIRSYLRKKKTNLNGKSFTSYIIDISSSEFVSKFVNEIGILGKDHKFNGKTHENKSSDYVPRSVLDEFSHSSYFFREHGLSAIKRKSTPKINRQIAAKCAIFENDAILQQKLSNFWTIVDSVEVLNEAPMYDLEVEETHNFVANNVFLHNSGKSEFIDEICEHLNIIHDWRVAYFSPENAPLAYHASKLIEKLTGKKFCKEKLPNSEYKQVKEHIQNNFFFIAPHEDFKIDTILERAKFLVRRKGIKVLVIDPYNRLENEMGNRNESLYISSVLDKLTTFAQINDVLVILMAHPTKMQRGKDGVQEIPTLYDISGSANFYNKADFGLIVHRDRQNELVEVRVQKVKFRHLGEPGVAKFKYNINNGRFVPYIDDLRPIEWDNTNHLQTKIEEQIEYQNRMQNGLFDKDDICPF